MKEFIARLQAAHDADHHLLPPRARSAGTFDLINTTKTEPRVPMAPEDTRDVDHLEALTEAMRRLEQRLAEAETLPPRVRPYPGGMKKEPKGGGYDTSNPTNHSTPAYDPTTDLMFAMDP